MAKKRKKEQEPKPSLVEAIGLSDLFRNSEKLLFFVGLLIFALSIFILLSFVSFFTTGQADQSMIENLRDGELANEGRKFINYCGSLGAYTAFFFIKQWFGLPAFFIPAFLLLVSLNLMKAYRVKLWKWFFAMMLMMLWFSVAFARFLSPLFTDAHFNPGGEHGVAICQIVEGYVGTPGLTALLALVALGFLLYVSTETIFLIRKVLNPSKFIDKIKFMIVDTSQQEVSPEDSYENKMQTLEDPTVFDNPESEVIEFDHEPAQTTVNLSDEDDDEFDDNLPAAKEKDVADDELDMDIEVAGEEEAAKGSLAGESAKNMEPYDPKREL